MKKITDGVYQDDAGAMHLVIEEMLDAAGYADTRENRETLTRAAIERVRETWPQVAIRVDDEPDVTRVAVFHCPRCGHKSDAIGSSDGSVGTPGPGDVCGCLACGLPMVFDVDPLTGLLRLRTMIRAEFDALSDHQQRELMRVSAFAQQVFQPSKRMN